ncbi:MULTISPECIES: hypothetical protein [unclassified Microcoleus]
MLSKLIRLISNFMLDPIYDAIFAEFVRRGNIIFEEDLSDDETT